MSSTSGKVLTAFLAGAMFGAFAMVEFAPAGSAQLTNATNDGGVAIQPQGDGAEGQDQTGTGDQDLAVGDVGNADGASNGGLDLSELENAINTAGDGGTTGGTTGGTSGGTTGGTTGGGDTGGDTGGSDSTDGGTTTGGSGEDSGTTDGGGGSVSLGTGGSGGGSGGTTGGSTGGSGCAADNGGATDTGVTADSIEVAATVVDDGPGASLLQPAKIGMQAVLNKVNSNNGICGRRIELETRNDGWDAQKGRQYIERFIEQDKFALLVVPSSEGLAEAIKASVIADAGIPVVGTTGLRIDEYNESWVFPVSTATISIMRIMAKYAYEEQGARTFGIIYDSKYKFGLEGKDAFVSYLNSLGDADIKAVQPLDPSQSSYGTQAQKFNQDCENGDGTPGCDMVALLLVPETAQKWANANSGDVNGRGRATHAAQTLFTGAFANACQGWCNGMTVWTGYVPPIPPVDQSDGVQTYIRDVENVNSSVDKTNQFLEGAYLGTQVFVDAVAACSPNVTRACIKSTLDQTDYDSDLVSQLSWRPGSHHANKAAQAFGIEATGNSFNGWEYLETGWVRDPNL